MDREGFPSGKHIHVRDYEPISGDVLSALPEGLVRRQMVVPVAKIDGKLIVAAVSKESQIKPEGLQLVAHCPVEMVWAPEEEISAFILAHYPNADTSFKPVVADIPDGNFQLRVGMKIPPALERLLSGAVVNRATEVLVEREGSTVRVRQRIRGVLVADMQAMLNLQDILSVFDFVGKTGELKTSNDLKWAEARLDFNARQENFICDLLLSETPDFGLLTMRLSRHGDKTFDPASWGMGPQQASVLESFINRTQGVVLFCGPDTDEVSANILACAKVLATPERHLIAVERARNGWFPGVEQMISNNDPAVFSKLLSQAFRHAPDVVIANALERKEHFEICLNESLKGRLVLARMFAQDVPDAMLQILGMGVEPYVIGSSLLGVVAQRTLRLNCPHCQDKDVVPRERIKELGIPIGMQPSAFFHGKGCAKCFKTGFDRETNIFEVLEMNDDLRNRLDRDMKSETFRTLVRGGGMMTLRQVAIHKAVNGQTSLSEVLRVTR